MHLTFFIHSQTMTFIYIRWKNMNKLINIPKKMNKFIIIIY